MVAELPAGLPRRDCCGEPGSGGGSGEFIQGEAAFDAHEPGLVGQSLPDQEPVLSMRPEFRPVVGDRLVQVQQSVLHEQPDHHGGNPFGAGVRPCHGVRIHIRAAGQSHYLDSVLVGGQLPAVLRVPAQE